MNDNELLEQFQMIAQGMAAMEKRLADRIDAKIQESETRMKNFVDTKIQESETRLNIKIENDITKRIDTLFDGYKLNHEKQWELERKTEKLESQIDDLQTRLALLEKKISA